MRGPQVDGPTPSRWAALDTKLRHSRGVWDVFKADDQARSASSSAINGSR
jgi:hypothetical protein